MKKIYLPLIETGTIISKILRKYTKHLYNHVSISLRDDLSEMYSFGRLNPYIFCWGGFVIEHPGKGIYKRFPKTRTKVLELTVSDQSFDIIKNCIDQFIRDKDSYGYNYRGIFAAKRNKGYQGSYRKFYCSQFVNYLLVCAHVLPEDYFGEFVRPEDFSSIENATVVYEGLLTDYTSPVDSDPT